MAKECRFFLLICLLFLDRIPCRQASHTSEWLSRFAYSLTFNDNNSIEGSGEETTLEASEMPEAMPEIIIYEHAADPEPDRVHVLQQQIMQQTDLEEKKQKIIEDEIKMEENDTNTMKEEELRKADDRGNAEPRNGTITTDAGEEEAAILTMMPTTVPSEWMTTTGKPGSGPFAKPTLPCPDGSTPEFSLHASTYCWSHSVCPTGTACIEGQCCQSNNNNTKDDARLRNCDPAKEWECADGFCIPKAGRCDGHDDCLDQEHAFAMGTLHSSTDELYCTTGNEKRSIWSPGSECAKGQFRCREDGACISNQRVCDHRYDCKDGSDELRCDYFVNAQMREEAKRLRESQRTAVGERKQQRTGEEPQPQPCGAEEIRCPDLPFHRCIHYSKLCDGVDDCGDGSDERGCTSQGGTAGTTPANLCLPGEFQCQSSDFCIAGINRCDRHYDCKDGSDELDCDYFREAEERRKNQLEEKRRQEEWHQQLRDRQKQAEDDQQKRERAQLAEQCRARQDFLCPDDTGQCIGRARLCDGHSDCADGADERDCGDAAASSRRW